MQDFMILPHHRSFWFLNLGHVRCLTRMEWMRVTRNVLLDMVLRRETIYG